METESVSRCLERNRRAVFLLRMKRVFADSISSSARNLAGVLFTVVIRHGGRPISTGVGNDSVSIRGRL